MNDAMTDIIVKIMIEVLNIFAIATKEMKQGRASVLLLQLYECRLIALQKDSLRSLLEERK